MLVGTGRSAASRAALALLAGACLPPELTFDPSGGGGGAGGAPSACELECGPCSDCSSGECERAAEGTPCEEGRCDVDGRCATGRTEWSRSFGGADDQHVQAITISPSDEVVIGGQARGSIDFAPEGTFTSAQGEDAFIVGLDPQSGGPLWTHHLGDEGEQQLNALCADSEALHAAGSFTGRILPFESSGGYDVFYFLRKEDGSPAMLPFGAEEETEQYSLAITKPDESELLLIGGAFRGELDGLVSSQQDAFIVRFGTGNLDYQRIGGAGDESVQALASAPGTAVSVAVGDFSADLQSGSCLLDVPDVCISGGFFVVASNCNVASGFCADGGSSAHVRAVAVASNGTIWITGFFEGGLSIGPIALTSRGEDVFVATLDSFGTPIFAKAFGGLGDDRGHAIAVDQDGNAFVGGRFAGSMDIGDIDLDGSGDTDAFVSKIAASGAPLWARAFAGPGEQAVTAITVDPTGSAFAVGGLEGSAFFGDEQRMSVEGADIFVVKLAP